MAEPRQPLSRREREVMDVLYRRGEASVTEVMESLKEPPTYSAVRSILRILKEKGQITHRADGPRYVYAPALGRERARKAALDHVVNTFFDGSAEQVLAALLDRSDLELNDTQIRRLTKAIRDAGEEGR